uniref:palmitoyl-protein hydrolase n=1 Tax=Clastoptera arizonana TaxID=38151 RepID=A0A1B6DM39_9HEMI
MFFVKKSFSAFRIKKQTIMASKNSFTIDSHVLGSVIVEPQTNHKKSASVIFLHGSGGSGLELKSSLQFVMGSKKMAFPHIELIYPTAPLQPYTPLCGEKSNVWFDRKAVHANVEEDRKSVDLMSQKIYTFIEDELVAKGTPYNRIIIGGFSMGGAMALHVIYRYCPQLAGVFTLSSFLNYDSLVYDDLKTRRSLAIDNTLPPLFSCHGDCDDLVSFEDGKGTFDNLLANGVSGEFHTIKGIGHEIQKFEIDKLRNWILSRLENNEDLSPTSS